MESHDLRIFKHVAELQSISKAAELLGYVQPNISQRIKGLEEELDTKLFARTNRGVTLTDEGKVLLEYTHHILLLMDEAKSKVNPSKWRESLIIGAPQTVSAIKIPQLFSSFLKENKHIDVKVKTATNRKLQEMLSYGEIDGLFLISTANRSQFETVYSYLEKMVLISPEYHGIEEKNNQTLLINSDPHCVYRDNLLKFSQENNFDQPIIMEFDSLESILQAVHDGLGISIVPADVAYSRKELQVFQYQELPEAIQIDFVIRKRKLKRQSLKQFIRFLEDQSLLT